MSLSLEQGKARQGKAKLFLCLTKHNAMKTYAGIEVQLREFLTLVLDRVEWSASRPGRFIPGVRAPGTHYISKNMIGS
jgi:hypothetical protein